MSAQGQQILHDLERHKHAFDFTAHDIHDAVAEAAAEGAKAAIDAYMQLEIDPRNASWVELSEQYERWKEAHYPGQRIGVLTGLMASPEQLKGELTITPHLLTQTYGTTEQAKLEAEWFQEGYLEQNRPARPFYELNDLGVHNVTAVFDHHFHTVVETR